RLGRPGRPGRPVGWACPRGGRRPRQAGRGGAGERLPGAPAWGDRWWWRGGVGGGGRAARRWGGRRAGGGGRRRGRRPAIASGRVAVGLPRPVASWPTA